MRIRHVVVDPPLVLAPMEGVTDLTFRRLIRRIGGCGLTVTEFVPAHVFDTNPERARELVRFDPDERPIAVQVYGRNPDLLARAAEAVERLGADIVDLNMGCPSKKVCKNSGGSALMKDMDLARDIVRAMRRATDLPFTVKMRSGWDGRHKNAPELAALCEAEGVDAITVHWRTREDGFGGCQEWDTVAAVKAAVSVPVTANGDIVDAPSALEALRATGCDGLMIGRGAIRNPWVFREVAAALDGRPVPSPYVAERLAVLMGYLDEIRNRFPTERGVLGRFKKIANQFTRGFAEGESLRLGILHAETLAEAETAVCRVLASCPEPPVC